MTVQEILVVFLLSFGTIFILVAAIGLNRMPDLYMRMHGTTKSTTLGITAIVLATVIYFGTSAAITRAILVVLFFFLTAPIATHMLARAAYLRDVERSSLTVLDELADSYDRESGTVESE